MRPLETLRDAAQSVIDALPAMLFMAGMIAVGGLLLVLP